MQSANNKKKIGFALSTYPHNNSTCGYIYIYIYWVKCIVFVEKKSTYIPAGRAYCFLQMAIRVIHPIASIGNVEAIQ
jgi:hypothetical protein